MSDDVVQAASKIVVMTGATGAIGFQVLQSCLARGWQVLTIGRNRPRIDCANRLSFVELDFADGDALDRALAMVIAMLQGRPLDGFVHVAAEIQASPVEMMTVREMQDIFMVNVCAPFAMLTRLLSQLEQARGRAVLIGSPSAAFPMPLLGAYAASKGAMTTMGSVLRMELGRSPVHVTTIQPGGVRSAIWDKISRQLSAKLEQMTDEQKRRYGDQMRAVTGMARASRMIGLEPAAVAAKVIEVLESAHPRTQYAIGSDARIAWTLGALPDSIRERLTLRYLKLVLRSRKLRVTRVE